MEELCSDQEKVLVLGLFAFFHFESHCILKFWKENQVYAFEPSVFLCS